VNHELALAPESHRGIGLYYESDTNKYQVDSPVDVIEHSRVKKTEQIERLTVKTWVNVSPGPIGHCVTPVGPSIELDPFWKSPWKCRPVVSLPRLFVRCIVIFSPTSAVSAGGGHCPLIPITGLLCNPSGFLETHVTSQV